MKKIFRIVILSFCLLALLVGCEAEGNKSGTNDTVQNEMKEPVEYSDVKTSPFYETFSSSKSLKTTEETLAASIPFPEGLDIGGFQGGYTDGRYHYQTFTGVLRSGDETDRDVYIVKYDLKKQSVVQQSGSIKLNHANDVTYNSKLGCFIVCHTNINRYQISFIDPETLTVIDTKRLGYAIYSIDYNEKYDRYVVGLSDEDAFRVLDADFKNVGAKQAYYTSLESRDFVKQGVACDDHYIYFVLYKSNVVTVYDWNGKFVTMIDLQGVGEPENISIVDGKIYYTIWDSSHQRSANLYRIDGFATK